MAETPSTTPDTEAAPATTAPDEPAAITEPATVVWSDYSGGSSTAAADSQAAELAKMQEESSDPEYTFVGHVNPQNQTSHLVCSEGEVDKGGTIKLSSGEKKKLEEMGFVFEPVQQAKSSGKGGSK